MSYQRSNIPKCVACHPDYRKMGIGIELVSESERYGVKIVL